MEIVLSSNILKKRINSIQYVWSPDRSYCKISISFNDRGWERFSECSGFGGGQVGYKGISFELYSEKLPEKKLKGIHEVTFIGLTGGHFYYSRDKRDLDITYFPYETNEKIYCDANWLLNGKTITKPKVKKVL